MFAEVTTTTVCPTCGNNDAAKLTVYPFFQDEGRVHCRCPCGESWEPTASRVMGRVSDGLGIDLGDTDVERAASVAAALAKHPEISELEIELERLCLRKPEPGSADGHFSDASVDGQILRRVCDIAAMWARRALPYVPSGCSSDCLAAIELAEQVGRGGSVGGLDQISARLELAEGKAFAAAERREALEAAERKAFDQKHSAMDFDHPHRVARRLKAEAEILELVAAARGIQVAASATYCVRCAENRLHGVRYSSVTRAAWGIQAAQAVIKYTSVAVSLARCAPEKRAKASELLALQEAYDAAWQRYEAAVPRTREHYAAREEWDQACVARRLARERP